MDMSKFWDEIEMRVEANMIEERQKSLTKYCNPEAYPEESIDPRYTFIYRAVACNNKVIEQDPAEKLVYRGSGHKQPNRHDRYVYRKNAAKKAAKKQEIRAKHARKFQNDPGTWIIEHKATGVVYYHTNQLWSEQGKIRREGKRLCREGMA